MSNSKINVVKDGLTGVGMGAAIIVPGISAGTIALILGSFKKITNAASKLFTKDFWKNLLILLPFGIGALVAIALLYFPFKFAFEYCMFAIVALFGGLILGSLPGIFDQVKAENNARPNLILMICGIVFAALIGVSSVLFDLGGIINQLFADFPFYLYFIIFAVGIIAASGIIVPGLSGSLILLVIAFYQPILGILEFNHGIYDLFLGIVFGLGIVVGFVLWSKLMDRVINKHRVGTLSIVIGFVIGSLFSIFFNSNMVGYLKDSAGLLDWILGPILVVVGIVVGYLFVRYTRKHPINE